MVLRSSSSKILFCCVLLHATLMTPPTGALYIHKLEHFQVAFTNALDSAVTSYQSNARVYLYSAFENLCLIPNHFPKAKYECASFERISVYSDHVFSSLEKGPFIYENRYKWLQKRSIKMSSLRFPITISSDKIINCGLAFSTVTAIHLDGNYSHFAPSFRTCLPQLFQYTKYLTVLTIETPCTHIIAKSLSQCTLLEKLSITCDDIVDTISQEIVQNLKHLKSLKILLRDHTSFTQPFCSDSIEDFVLERENFAPYINSLPDITFPRLKTLVYRVCYITEKSLVNISSTCPELMTFDMRGCVTGGPRREIVSGLHTMSTRCKKLYLIQIPKWI